MLSRLTPGVSGSILVAMTQTTVTETRGETVHKYVTNERAIYVVSDYVRRGFDVVCVVDEYTVRLASGNAVVDVTRGA